MVACGDFGRGFYFTILTLITIGASAGLLITLLVYFIKLHLNEASEAVLAAIIVAMCASILLLIYGFYASLSGGPCHKAILSFVYLIFALALGAFGICILALKKQIIKVVGDQWAKGTEFVHKFENQLNCTDWNSTSNTSSTSSTSTGEKQSCKQVFEDFYRTFGTGISIGLIVLFGLLMIGDVFAWKFVCDKEHKKDEKGPSQSLTAPLTYSW
jgi:hypothetical protein